MNILEYISNYYYILLFVILLVLIHSHVLNIDDKRNLVFFKVIGSILLVFLFIYMGFRPIPDQIEYDTAMYKAKYILFQNQIEVDIKDPVFDYFMLGSSKFISYIGFFILCAFFYVYFQYRACKNWFGKYAFHGFLFFVVSLSFLAYGTNTIRSGLASSFFLFAISTDRRFFKYLFLLLAVGLHQSFLLPALVYIILNLRKTHRLSVYIYIWIGAILVSLMVSNILANTLLNIDLLQDRVTPYISAESDFGLDKYKVGFRWDFILYSSLPILFGIYMYYKKKYRDTFFRNTLILYMLLNSFWVLIIRIPYTDRFAYLSWCLLPLLFSYPILNSNVFVNKNKVAGNTIFLLFLLTFSLSILR